MSLTLAGRTSLSRTAPERRAGIAATALATWFVADWRQMLFVHYRVPAEILQPHVPHPLDLHDGSAWVSLVFFRLEGMRPPGTGAMGRALLRPVSNHAFLNVRTYVHAEAGPGIHFLAEWIPNKLATWLGPKVYGLPYRLGKFAAELSGAGGGVGQIAVEDAASGARLRISFPTRAEQLSRARANSTEEFLLERYTAYTARRGKRRYFEVAHESWEFHAVDWVRTETTLLERAFPWFSAARFDSAHRTPGVNDVRMSRPAGLNRREER